MLDEIDKLGQGWMGSPESALLEVLDPEQNNSFTDHYLELPFDLSEVMFIATANQLDPIPWALRDRLEIIELPGYTRQEKLHIARSFLVPKQLSEHGLDDDHCEVTDDAIYEVVDSYTREAGVRNLEREIGAVCRAVAVKVAEGEAADKEVIGPDQVAEYLGPTKFVSEVADRTAEPGVATGLAWTAVGGDILFIEATRMPGKGKLTLTGQLGDVMKESVTAALSFIRSRAAQLGLESGNFLENTDIHVHVPAGGIPKDGPSAGVTMYTALVSLLTGTPVRPDVAMTGEITLRGNVLQIGGVKEKLLAAHRAGIKRVIIPDRNIKDLVDVPDEVKNEIEILPVKRMDEVLIQALTDPPEGIVKLVEEAAQAESRSGDAQQEAPAS
jgi:ATP-dependent Lon protease